MGNPLEMKLSWVVAVVLVLAHVSPAAAGMLVCIGDGAVPDCCDELPASESGAAVTAQLLDGSDCRCCITVDTKAATADATAQKAPVDSSSASGVSRNAVSPPTSRSPRQVSHDPGDPRLASLRTVVLLI